MFSFSGSGDGNQSGNGQGSLPILSLEEAIFQQMEKLDKDLAIMIAISGVSLDVKKVVETVSVINQVSLERKLLDPKFKDLTKTEQEHVDYMRELFLSTRFQKGKTLN
jgi:hypothetical protein